MPDVIVVGAGLFGLTAARALANAGRRVTVLETRDHLGGNAWADTDPDTGIEVHRYGAHIFHTSNERAWRWATSFGEFTDYRHRVQTRHAGRVYPLPFSLAMINQVLGADLSPAQARAWVENERVPNASPANLEEQALALIGPTLYSAFVRGYTAKQWQADPRTLPAEVIRRLPVRYNYDTRYFTDTYEGLPVDGYARWLSRMADHPRLGVALGVSEDGFRAFLGNTPVIYTGPVDAFFKHSHGRLSWRSVTFETETLDVDDYQGCAVMNEADEHVLHTRTIEFKHFRPERRTTRGCTVIAREFSHAASDTLEPYYPVNSADDRALLSVYRNMAASLAGDVWFGGRLGTYSYLDMHMAIGSALTLTDRLLETGAV